MRQIFTTIFLCILIGHNLTAQKFKENSVGIAFLTDQNETEYELKIVFPFESLTGYSIENPILELKNPIHKFNSDCILTLFDNFGVLTRLEGNNEFNIEFWCENDGGIQFRPVLNKLIKKNLLDRKVTLLENQEELDRIFSFILINENSKNPIQSLNSEYLNKKILMNGDLNNDGKVDVLIYKEIDETGICNWSYHLLQFDNDFYLNCCGP